MSAVDYRAHYKAVRERLVGPVKAKPVDRIKIIATIRYHEPIGPIMPPSEAERRAFQAAHDRYTNRLMEFANAERELLGLEAYPMVVSTRVTAQRIIDEVCAKHGMTEAQLCSDQRVAHIVKARFEAYYRLSAETTWNTTQIGRFMGGKDRSSVSHGIRQHIKRYKIVATDFADAG